MAKTPEKQVLSFKDVRESKLAQESKEWTYQGTTFRTIFPTPRVEQEAELLQRQTFFSLLSDGETKTESQLVDFAENKELFSRAEATYGGKLDEVERDTRKKVIELQEELEKIAPEGIDVESLKTREDWEEVVEMAKKTWELRQKLLAINNARNEITGGSANSLAENERDNYLLIQCTQFNAAPFIAQQEKGEELTKEELNELEPEWMPVWADTEDFLDEQDSTLVKLAKGEYFAMTWGLITDQDSLDKQFPESRIIRASKEEGSLDVFEEKASTE